MKRLLLFGILMVVVAACAKAALAEQNEARVPTGGERYLASRMSDPEYRAAYDHSSGNMSGLIPATTLSFWKFVHNTVIHPILGLCGPWHGPPWLLRAHDWTAKRCQGHG